MSGRFATLTFKRKVPAPVSVLWQAWSAPAARAVWAAPTPTVTVEFLQADTRVGGREVSLCKVEGVPDIRCEVGWLALQSALGSVNYEVISCEGVTQSAALVTADFTESGDGSHVVVTVQLSSLAEDMETGYRQGFGAGLDNLAGVAERTMILQHVIQAPRNVACLHSVSSEAVLDFCAEQGDVSGTYTARAGKSNARRGHGLPPADAGTQKVLRLVQTHPRAGVRHHQSVLGLRQFLPRGLDNVTGEWTLVTVAWNMKRMFAMKAA
jgi:uncharacterized protein YndB with AHSA1/START domain